MCDDRGQEVRSVKTVGLVHGPYHGAACRAKLIPELGRPRLQARERLGVDPIELPGGHSPFVGRPAELARAIATLA